MRHFEQLTREEIADILDLTTTAVCCRYIQALDRLNRAIQSFNASTRAPCAHGGRTPTSVLLPRADVDVRPTWVAAAGGVGVRACRMIRLRTR
jgi:hypothetical protein